MWLKAYLTFSDTRAGRGVRMLQESERDINDDWQDGGEGATDWEERKKKNSLFSGSVCGWLIRPIRGESHQGVLLYELTTEHFHCRSICVAHSDVPV